MQKILTVQEKLEKIGRSMSIDPDYFSPKEHSLIESLLVQHYPPTRDQLKFLESVWNKHLKR